MSPLKKVFLLGLNDLRLTVRDRASLLWMLFFPLAFMWFFGQMNNDSGEIRKIVLQVESRDSGWLGAAFLQELEDESVLLEKVTAGDEKERTRTLIIPEGFTEGVLAGEQQTVTLLTEPGANPKFSLAAQMHAVRVIARTVARLIEVQARSPATGELDAGAFAALGDRPPLVSVETSTAGRGRRVPGGYSQSVPGTLTFTVLMMTLIYGAVFLATEKQTGMLRRQASLPVTHSQIFLGKLLGRIFVAGAQVVVLVLAGQFLFGVSWWGGSATGLALVLATYTAAVASLATLLGAVVRSPEQASGFGWLSSMVMAALGGCWWPSEVMPRWLWHIAHAFPTAWAMDAFHSLLSFGNGLEGVLLPAAVLLGFAVLFALLGARFLEVG